MKDNSVSSIFVLFLVGIIAAYAGLNIEGAIFNGFSIGFASVFFILPFIIQIIINQGKIISKLEKKESDKENVE